MKICANCYTAFVDSIIIAYEDCPILSCGGPIMDIDENLIDVCILLNKKGHATRYSCSGHIFDKYPQTYIQFWGEVVFPNIPTGFNLETKHFADGSIITNMEKSYATNLPSIELQKQIWETLRTLLDWAEELETADELLEWKRLFTTSA